MRGACPPTGGSPAPNEGSPRTIGGVLRHPAACLAALVLLRQQAIAHQSLQHRRPFQLGASGGLRKLDQRLLVIRRGKYRPQIGQITAHLFEGAESLRVNRWLGHRQQQRFRQSIHTLQMP